WRDLQREYKHATCNILTRPVTPRLPKFGPPTSASSAPTLPPPTNAPSVPSTPPQSPTLPRPAPLDTPGAPTWTPPAVKQSAATPPPAKKATNSAPEQDTPKTREKITTKDVIAKYATETPQPLPTAQTTPLKTPATGITGYRI